MKSFNEICEVKMRTSEKSLWIDVETSEDAIVKKKYAELILLIFSKAIYNSNSIPIRYR